MRYFLFFIFLWGAEANSQTEVDLLDQIAGNIVQRSTAEAREMVALHIDKAIYRAGSTIWFRAYMFSSNSFPVKDKSNIAFVDLVNHKDSVIEYALLNLDSLQYHGGLLIPQNLPGGFYQLRAYTRSIIKQNPGDVFLTPVFIVSDKLEDSTVERPDAEDQPIIRFYPEGDHLVNGVKSAVFFEATDRYGNPAAISGIVKDNRDSVITKFNGFGIGKFSFEPYSKDRTYKVLVNSAKKPNAIYPLPELNAGSYQLSLHQRTADYLVFRVALGDSLYKNQASSILLAVGNGKICFASYGKGMYLVNVPLHKLPGGIVQFYLFNDKKEIVSKRAVFVESKVPVTNITVNRSEFNNRQKANVSLSITDAEGKPVRAVFSVAVTDNKLTIPPSRRHPAFDFLLQHYSQLLYDSTQADLDLVAAIADKQQILAITPQTKETNFYWEGLELKGKILNKDGKGLSNDLVIVRNSDSEKSFSDSTDSNGAYCFRNLVFTGTKRFAVMLPSLFGKEKKYNVINEDPLYPSILSYDVSNYRMNSSLSEALLLFKKIQADSSVTGLSKSLLQRLALEATNKKKLEPKKGLGPYRITADMLDKLNLSNTVDAVKMVPGVTMVNGRLTVRGGLQAIVSDLSDIEPLLVVDGVPAATTSLVGYLNSIPPFTIDYIEVLTGPEAALYGSRAGNGVILVKTTNQIRAKTRDQAALHTIIARGFHNPPTFFVPAYEIDAVREVAYTDNRATIYWNGEIISDAAGKASFSFYTADLKNDYTITVRGITDKGELISTSYLLKKK